MTTRTHAPADLATCFAQVLVPIDFSAMSWRSLSAATAMARAFGVPYRLVHIDCSSPWREEGSHALTLRTSPRGRPVRVEVIAARTPADGIIRALGDDESSLLVMSSHGHTAAAEIALGSTAHDVLRRWQGPVVLTGPSYRTARPAVTRIVVALPPFADVSSALVADVRAWANGLKVPVEVMSVTDVPPIAYDAELRREQLHHLTELADTFGAQPVHVPGPRTAHEIFRYANATAGTLLAMSPHVRPVVAELVLGSVSNAVLRHAVGPILMRRA